MTAISKSVYIDKLGDLVDEFNNTYHKTIKVKPGDKQSSTCNEFNKKNNKEYPKFEVGDHVRIWKYKNIFAKTTLQIGLKKFLSSRKLKILYHGYMY